MNKIFTILFSFVVFFFGLTASLYAQDEQSQTHYKVEQKFEPAQQDIINNFVGKKATPFIASDMEYLERYLTDYKAQACVIYFWNLESPASLELLPVLNDINQLLADKSASIIGMADDPRAEIEQYLTSNPIQFANIPNAEMLSEAMYAAELGYPRVFILDEYQIVRHIITPEHLKDAETARSLIEKFILKYTP